MFINNKDTGSVFSKNAEVNFTKTKHVKDINQISVWGSSFMKSLGLNKYFGNSNVSSDEGKNDERDNLAAKDGLP